MICWLCLAVRRCKHFHLFFNFFQAASLYFPFFISILSQINQVFENVILKFFLLWYLYSLLNPPRARYQQIVCTTTNLRRKRRPYHKDKPSYENFTLLLKQTHVLDTCRCRIHNFQVRYIHSHFSILLWTICKGLPLLTTYILFSLKYCFFTFHNLTIATSHDLVSCPLR